MVPLALALNNLTNYEIIGSAVFCKVRGAPWERKSGAILVISGKCVKNGAYPCFATAESLKALQELLVEQAEEREKLAGGGAGYECY